MVDWTPEAIASFESSTNMGPLTDLCIPGTQVILIVIVHACMRKGTTWPRIKFELWTLSVVYKAYSWKLNPKAALHQFKDY